MDRQVELATQRAPSFGSRLKSALYLLAASILSPAWGDIALDESIALDYRVIAAYPHRNTAFTQGLIFDQGVLYESTGGYGESALARVDLVSGRWLAERRLPDEYFGEGLTVVGDILIQLTWQAGIALVYDRHLKPERALAYPGEGWGLTSDGQSLFMSDGSATLYRREPESMALQGRVEVSYLGNPVDRLNELEWIEGLVWANRWGDDLILVIDPVSGDVIHWLDMSELRGGGWRWRFARELNGIAYDTETKHVLVTGKNWPDLFVLELDQFPE
ncbi:MAG: glutamine cyclotransferase [Porticoccaceae bacterium]|nr:glutamine cyclotransferase [Porticoccaceae bacterium]